MGIQLLHKISTADHGLTLAILKLLLLFGIVALGLVILVFLGQLRHREYVQSLREERLQAEKERFEAENDAIKETKQQIAFDLHDGGTYHLRLALAELDLALQNTTLREARLTILRAAVLLERHKKELRNVSHTLKGEHLFINGIHNAIQKEAERIKAYGFLKVQTNLDLNLHLPLNSDQQMLIYRIFQESMNNILKHSKADSVIIELTRDANQLRLYLEDDGVGFNPDIRKTSHGGLYNLYHRAQILRAKINIVTSPGTGTQVELLVPLHIPPKT